MKKNKEKKKKNKTRERWVLVIENWVKKCLLPIAANQTSSDIFRVQFEKWKQWMGFYGERTAAIFINQPLNFMHDIMYLSNLIFLVTFVLFMAMLALLLDALHIILYPWFLKVNLQMSCRSLFSTWEDNSRINWDAIINTSGNVYIKWSIIHSRIA